MPEPPRISIEGRHTRHTAVPHAGWSRVPDATTTPLEPHQHTSAYEICLIVSGEVEWWVGDEIHTVGPGQIYVTRPGEIHGGVGEVIQPAELYWCGLSLPGPRGALGLSPTDARHLADRFGGMSRRVFASSPHLSATFARLIAAMQRPDTLSRLQVRAAVLDLATGTLVCHDAGVAAHPAPSREIRRVMRWVQTHLGEEQSIERLAELAGLAVSRFHERFADETGYPPGDWRLRQRIAAAKQRLRTTDRPVTRIAMEVGFGSSQYFATAFKRLVGVSPSRYRQQAAARAEGRPRG